MCSTSVCRVIWEEPCKSLLLSLYSLAKKMAENTKTNGSAEEISQKYLPKDNKIEVSCI